MFQIYFDSYIAQNLNLKEKFGAFNDWGLDFRDTEQKFV
jgi:hypothetical protein